MWFRLISPLLIPMIMTLSFVALCPVLISRFTQAQTSRVAQTPKDSEELARMYRDDQADRSPTDARAIDWSVVAVRDRARLARVKEMYAQNKLQSANDYYHSAMILQHGDVADDFLLAHEFCIVAIAKGKNDRDARWLSAASEDRFLMNIGRPQRFATQYRSEGRTSPMRLYQVDTSVTDELRRGLDVPSLAAAKAREAEFNRPQP